MNKEFDAVYLNNLRDEIYNGNVKAGWYIKPDAVKQMLSDIEPELGDYFEMMREMAALSLIHSEVSEAVEGVRKEIPDDHLPHRTMAEVELADTLIRIMDLCGRRGYDIGGAVFEKLDYNKKRADHKLENRNKVGGKKI